MRETTPTKAGTAAIGYHADTSHTEARLRADRHYLDWPNKPIPFKLYRSLESVPLPADAVTLTATDTPAIEAIGPGTGGNARGLDLKTLARLLFLGAGITKRKSYPGGEVYFRAYPNTGALYHVDLYVVNGAIDHLPAGVWHFGPNDFALHRLRDGDYRRTLIEASGDYGRVANASAVLVSASTYWRNAWKYRARAYRHCFWDAGTMLANLLSIAGIEHLNPCLVMGFADNEVEALLGLDPMREGALALLPIGISDSPAPESPPLETREFETEPLSPSEIDYPAIRAVHAATSLGDGAAAAGWHGEAPPCAEPPAGAPVQPLEPLDRESLPRRSIAEVIVRRGSTRAFDRQRAIGFDQLSTLLSVASDPLAADFLGAERSTLVELYLIVNAVHGLEPGSYYFHRAARGLELLESGQFRARAGHLGLDQELPADAAVNVYALCALGPVVERFGDRGYRAAQMEGGILGGRLYLAAYALGLGATGLTFFDEEVIAFFSPHAAGKDVMFLTAIGHADRSRLRPQGVARS